MKYLEALRICQSPVSPLKTQLAAHTSPESSCPVSPIWSKTEVSWFCHYIMSTLFVSILNQKGKLHFLDKSEFHLKRFLLGGQIYLLIKLLTDNQCGLQSLFVLLIRIYWCRNLVQMDLCLGNSAQDSSRDSLYNTLRLCLIWTLFEWEKLTYLIQVFTIYLSWNMWKYDFPDEIGKQDSQNLSTCWRFLLVLHNTTV